MEAMKTITDVSNDKKISQLILTTLCDNEQVDIKDVKGHPGKYGKKRSNELVRVRQMFCYFAKKYTSLSLREIGSFVNYDHSSVLYAIKIISNEITIYPVMRLKAERYSKLIDMKINFSRMEDEDKDFFLYYDFYR